MIKPFLIASLETHYELSLLVNDLVAVKLLEVDFVVGGLSQHLVAGLAVHLGLIVAHSLKVFYYANECFYCQKVLHLIHCLSFENQ